MRIAIILLMITPLLLNSCANPIKGVEKNKNFQAQLKYKYEKTLDVTNQNGSIAIQAQDGAEFATVTATLKAVSASESTAQAFLDQMDIRFAKEGDELSVEAIYPKAWSMTGKAKKPSTWSIDFTIIIPGGMDIKCTNVNGDIRASGPSEKVNAQTQNGNVNIKNNKNEIIVVTTNGNVEIDNEQDYNISLQIGTRNGNLSVDMPLAQMGKFACRTTNGNIVMNLPSGFEPKIELNTFNGNIDLILGTRLSAKLEIKTTNGSVKSNMVVNTSTGVGGILEKKVIKGVVGGGFGDVKATTKNGNIEMNYSDSQSSEPVSESDQTQT